MVNPPPSLKPAPVIDIEHHLSNRLFHRGFHLNKCIFKATGESKYQGAINFKLEFDHLTKKAGQHLTLELPYKRCYVKIIFLDSISGSESHIIAIRPTSTLEILLMINDLTYILMLNRIMKT